MGKLTGPRVLQTIYFGGGTPSLMDPNLVNDILEMARKTWPMANDCEITLEANPTSVEAGRFRDYRSVGVNRVSVGIQAFNDHDLRRLGRMHTASEAREALEIARSAFERVSFDLIYARQGQSLQDWGAELQAALELVDDHLSLYQLTIEDGTVFGERHKTGQLSGLPGEDLAANMYELTQDLCDKAGMCAYEVSNHAGPGGESRHNLIYWRYGDYAGIGPGAHGRLTLSGQRWATEAVKNPGQWLRSVFENGAGDQNIVPLTGLDQANEYLMMGLRLSEGVSIKRYLDLNRAEKLSNKFNMLIDIHLLRAQDDRLYTTQRGRILLNAVLRELIGD